MMPKTNSESERRAGEVTAQKEMVPTQSVNSVADMPPFFLLSI